MDIKKLLIVLLVSGALMGSAYGAAATLGGLDAPALGAETELVSTCDTDGVDVKYTVTSGDISKITVSQIGIGANGDECDTDEIAVQLVGTSTTVTGQNTIGNTASSDESVDVCADTDGHSGACPAGGTLMSADDLIEINVIIADSTDTVTNNGTDVTVANP